MSLAPKLTQFRRQIRDLTCLIRVRHFSMKELRWFLFSIIIISSLFTISASFILGFNTQEVFVGQTQDPNLLIISQPNAYTPSQSQVPLYWSADIIELEGIDFVSPETVDIVVDQTHKQPVFFRGVTQEYLKIEKQFQFKVGDWFQNSSTSLNQIVVGTKYAELTGINLGDHLILNSRPFPIILDVVVAGLFETNTIADEGLLGPLWMGRLFAGLGSDLINIIRITFNPQVYQREVLSDIILGQHTLELQIFDKINAGYNLTLTEVEIYSRSKTIINTSSFDMSNKTIFLLPFGKYFIRNIHPDITYQPFIPIFLTNQTKLDIGIGQEFYNLHLNITFANIPVNKGDLKLYNFDSDETQMFQTDEFGYFSEFIPEGTIRLEVSWIGYSNFTIFLLDQNLSVNIDFSERAEIQVVNASNKQQPLAETSVEWQYLDSNIINSAITNFNGTSLLSIIPHVQYNVTISNDIFQRNFVIKFDKNSFETFLLGFNLIEIQLKDINENILALQQVNITLDTQESILLTNSTGWISLSAKSGSNIRIQTLNPITNATVSWSFDDIHQPLIQLIVVGLEKSNNFNIRINSNRSLFKDEFLRIFLQENNTESRYSKELQFNHDIQITVPDGIYLLEISNNTHFVSSTIVFNKELNDTIILSFDMNMNISKFNATGLELWILNSTTTSIFNNVSLYLFENNNSLVYNQTNMAGYYRYPFDIDNGSLIIGFEDYNLTYTGVTSNISRLSIDLSLITINLFKNNCVPIA